MPLKPETRDKLASVGTTRVAAALAKRGARQPAIQGLRPLSPFQDALVGEAAMTIDACPPGGVVVLEAGAASVPVAVLARRRVAGVVSHGALRHAAEIVRSGIPAYQRLPGTSPRPLSIAVGEIVFGDRSGVIVIPALLVDDVAEEAVEAAAYEEFLAEQVDAGGGVYGLHIPSGEHARRAFTAWRRMKGR